MRPSRSRRADRRVGSSLTPSRPVRVLTIGLTVSSLAFALRAAANLPKLPFRVGQAPDRAQGGGDRPTVELPVRPGPSRGELFFIDADVADPNAFWLAAPAGATVVCIPAGVDSWEYMAQEADHFRGLAAVHLISHGEPGVLVLNRRRYTAADLESRTATLQRLGRALGKNGDFLIYGCDTGAGAAGAKLVNELAEFTGADVGASANETGGLPGADWQLEVVHGQIETPMVAPESYHHVLASFSVSTIASLRTAISTAVANNTDDVIYITGNISATSSADMVTGPDGKPTFVVVNNTDGHTITIVGGGNTLDAGHYGRGLYVQAGSVQVSNLTITKGLLSGNGGAVNTAAEQKSYGAGVFNAGTLVLNGVTVTANKASGGGGGGGIAGGVGGGGGGGGAGFGGIGGGTGGSTSNSSGSYAGVAGSSGNGGRGGSYDGVHLCGMGGTSTGGAGGSSGSAGYMVGGSGATASNGTISIGGGGGGAGFTAAGGLGGPAAGGLFNSGTIYILGSSAISSNLGAGGGGGGGASGAYGYIGNGGAGGRGVGGIWNTGTLHIAAAINSGMSGNAGASGGGGTANGSNTSGTTPTASTNLYNAGTQDLTYANTAPTFVGATTTLSIAQNASATDIKSLLHVSDADASQTETWSQAGAPSHGTLTITSATASSGSTDITPGGTITYTPTNGYSGSDSFDVQVSDGTVTAVRTITVTILAPPSITSSLTATGTYGSAISTYTITASNSPTSYNATGLPTGLSVNTANGQITGTPTATAGSPYSVTISATNGGGTGSATLVFTINKATLTVTGVTAANKTYDGTTAATLNTGSAALSGAVNGDSLTLDTTSAAGTFATASVGTGKTVTASGFAVTGTNSTNYTLTQPSGLTANITAKALTVSGLSGTDKVYNATTSAALSGTAALASAEATGTGTTSDGKPYTGDTVSVTGTASGTFADANVGTAKTISISGLSLTGAQAANYTLTAPTASANITAKTLTLSGVAASNKVYNATTAAALTGTAALASAEAAGTGTTSDGKPYTGDTLSIGGTGSGVFADANVGAGKAVTVTGYTLGGTSASNYSLTQPTGLTANITTKTLTVSGVTAADKVYDAATTATLNGTAALATAEAPGAGTTSDGVPYTGDTVSLTGTAAGAFADKNVGSGKTVTVSGLSLTGAQASNYALGGLTATSAITAKSLTVSGVTASNRVYDGSTTAPLGGTAALAATEAAGTGTSTDGQPFTGDTVSLTGTAAGTFADRHVATGKAVTVTGLSLTGSDATNYSVVQPTGLTADVTAKALTASGVAAAAKVYNATTVATLTGTAVIPAAEAVGTGTTSDGKPYTVDTVSLSGAASGTFASKDVGTGIAVTVSGLSLGGTDAGDYTLTAPAGLSANITAKALTASGLVAASKVYNATTAASLSGTEALPTAEAPGAGTTSDGTPYTGDTVALTGTASGAFSSAAVGTSKTVTISGLSLTGAQASNYTLTVATTAADITAKALTVTGLSGTDRVYDATTTAALSGTAALATAEAAGAGTTSDGKPYTGDTVSVTGTPAGTFADANVGSGKAITISGLSLTGAQASNYTLTAPTATATVSAKTLALTGVSAADKVYDATSTASLTGTAALATAEAAGTGTSVDGKPYSGDTLTLGGTGAATFADANVGSAKAVTVTGYTLGGSSASNYSLAQPTGLAANVTAKTLTISGVTASSKVYDATTTATLSGTATLPATEAAGSGTSSDGKPYTGDAVSLTGTISGAFADANAGSGKTVTVSGLSLTGAQATNYAIGALTATATISAKSLTISGLAASNRTYDGTLVAPLTGTASLGTAEAAGTGSSGDGLPYSGDAVSVTGTAAGTFADRHVGTAKAVTVSGLTLTGAKAANYSAVLPTGLTANIAAKPLAVSGLSASGKVYDATTSAALSGTAALAGTEAAGTGSTADGAPYTGDAVALAGTAVGTFAAKDVATGVAVTVTGLSLSGGDAGDYSLTAPAGLTANITAKSLLAAGVSATSKVYDATTAATLSGTEALPTAEAAGSGTSSDGKPYTGDAVALTGTVAGAFATKNAGSGIAVTISGVSLTGAQAANYTLTLAASSANITAKALTVSGLSGVDKVYDATSGATLGGTAALAAAEAAGAGTSTDGKPFTGDVVSLAGTPGASFADANVGAGKAITISGLSLTGAQAANYTLTAPSTTAAITAKPLTITGLAAGDKPYDATTAATLTGTAGLQPSEVAGTGTASDGKPYAGDSLTLGGTGAAGFADANVGAAKPVTVSGYTLGGASATNYTLTQPSGLTAAITAKLLTISGVNAANKVYDATTTAAISGTPALAGAEAPGTGTSTDGKPYSGDTVAVSGTPTGAFATAAAGAAKAVTVSGLTLSGAQAANYAVGTLTSTATITPKAVAISGLTGVNRTYDGTTTAGLSGTATLGAAEAAGAGTSSDGLPYTGDTVTVTGTAAGSFADRHVATGKAITVTGLSLSGAQASNYTANQPTGVTATITAKALATAGLAATAKIYDGTTAAALSGTAALAAAEAPGAGTAADGAPYTGDAVSLTGTPAGTFAAKDVGGSVGVTVTGLTLAGGDASDYALTAPAGLAAAISAKTLVASGLTAVSRTYDGTTGAALSGTESLRGAEAPGTGTVADGAPYVGDAVALTGTASGAFATKTVGTAKPVTITGLALTGAQAGNYVLTLSGASATVSAKTLTVTGITASNKVYDGTTAATIGVSGAALAGTIVGDTVSVALGGATGAFADPNVGNGKTVTVTGLSLSGADAANYTVTLPTTTANITAATASFVITGTWHPYDGQPAPVTVAATPSGLPTTITYAGSTTVPTNAGTYPVVVTATDPNYQGSASATLTIAPAAQSVTFVAPRVTLGVPVALTASASSGLPVWFRVLSGGATISSDGRLTVTTPGTISLRAQQDGNGNYLPAVADVAVTVAKLTQVITFAAVPDKRTTDGAFTLNATASSGLPVAFTVTSGPAMLSGSALTMTGLAGTVVITATQDGNAMYAAAPAVAQSFTVTAVGPRVFMGPAFTTSGTVRAGDVGAVLPPTGNSGTLLIVVPSLGVDVELPFTIGADGTFVLPVTVTAAASAAAQSAAVHAATATTRTLTLRGQLVANVLSARFDEIDLAFTTTVQSSGPTTPEAGLYVSTALNSAAGTTYTIVGNNGQVLSLTVTATGAAIGGTTSLAADNSFALTGTSGSLKATINPATATVAGTVSQPGLPDATFTGIATSALRTDRLLNLSSRARVGSGDGQTLITGFVIGGTTAKRVLLRAVGPTLTSLGINSPLANPKLQLFDAAGKPITANDDWSGSDTAAAMAQVGAFPLPAGSADAALVLTLDPGAYTMHVSDGAGSGVALAEIYDASANPQAEYQRLINISSRGMVDSGEGVLIGGFVVTGNSPKRVLIRGVGPGLTAFGVGGVLADPQLRLFDASRTVIAANDDWGTPTPLTSTQVAATPADISAAGQATGAFALAAGSKDAAIVITLAPGAYTAQVNGAAAATGVALIEIYELPQ